MHFAEDRIVQISEQSCDSVVIFKINIHGEIPAIRDFHAVISKKLALWQNYCYIIFGF